MDPKSNYFDLFSLPVAYPVDRRKLDERYLKLQQQFHPDRYAGKGDTEKRLAVQTISLINQAYEALKSPLQRAAYLLELRGVNADRETHVTSDGEFLMQQMQLRETLDDVAEKSDPAAALDQFRDVVEDNFRELQTEFQTQYEADELTEAFDTLAKMQFFSKLLGEAELLEAELED